MLVIQEVKWWARDRRRHALPENFCRAARVRNFLIRHPCAFRVFVLTELVGGGSDFCRKYYHFGKDLCPEPSVSPEEGFWWLVAWFAWRKRSRKYYKSALSSILKSHPRTQVHSEDPTWANMAADLEQLRQEAENLRKKIRVSGERELAGGAWNEGGGMKTISTLVLRAIRPWWCVRWGEWREGKS